MKILADENIPNFVLKELKRKGWDVLDIKEFKRGLTDREIIKIAEKEGRIILSLDKDFIHYHQTLSQNFIVVVLQPIPQTKQNFKKITEFIVKTGLLNYAKNQSLLISLEKGIIKASIFKKQTKTKQQSKK